MSEVPSDRPSFFRRYRRWIYLALFVWFSLPLVAWLALELLGALGGGMSRGD
jgi:hypothetical protein